MRGAMQGLADGLDPDSAYLTPDQVKQVEEAARRSPPGDVGLELTRQYYLRVIAARDDSPAAKAGIRTGDYIRAINDKPTREMSVWEGVRALRGTPGSKVTVTVIRGNAADPHVIDLTRETGAGERGQRPDRGAGHRLRAHRRHRPETAARVKAQIAELTKSGAAKLIVDVRRTSTGTMDNGIDAGAAVRAAGNADHPRKKSRGGARETIAAASGDGPVTLPRLSCIDAGTSGAAELFAAALSGNKRARPDRRAHDRPRRHQKLVKLSGRRRPLALDHALSHALGRPAARKGARTDRRGGRTRRRVRPEPGTAAIRS